MYAQIRSAEIPQRRLAKTDAPLVRRVYQTLGLNPASRDFEVHCQAMAAVCDELHIEPINRWSRLQVGQIYECLTRWSGPASMAA